MKKFLKITAFVLSCILLFGLLTALGINGWVLHSGGKYICSLEQAKALEDVDCILVLGCGVLPSGRPTAMLRDRLDKSVELYQAGISERLLMSGDHGTAYYDEVNTMKSYAMDKEVPSEHIFMDHAGFSTYESMYRAKEVFCAKRVVIVTQKYHLYRAIYVARALGLEAYGVAAAGDDYGGQLYRDIREVLARNKDFFTSIFKPQPEYLGKAIPVSGNGDITNDT